MDLELLRKTCLSFPGATEGLKWEDHLVFSVGDKMFCMTGFDPPFGCTFKVKDEEFEEMSSREGIIPAPYLARARWVAVRKASALGKTEWKHYLQQSYELVKAKLTKKLRTELGI